MKRILLLAVIVVVIYYLLKKKNILGGAKGFLEGAINSEDEALKLEAELKDIVGKYTPVSQRRELSNRMVDNVMPMGIDVTTGTIIISQEVGIEKPYDIVSLKLDYPFRPCLAKDKKGVCVKQGELMFIPKGTECKVIKRLNNHQGFCEFAVIEYSGYEVAVEARNIVAVKESNFSGSKLINSVMDAPDVTRKSVEMGGVINGAKKNVPIGSPDYKRSNEIINKLFGYAKRLDARADNGEQLDSASRRRVATYTIIQRAGEYNLINSDSSLNAGAKESELGKVVSSLSDGINKLFSSIGNLRKVGEKDLSDSGYKEAVADESLYSGIAQSMEWEAKKLKSASELEKAQIKNNLKQMVGFLPSEHRGYAIKKYGL